MSEFSVPCVLCKKRGKQAYMMKDLSKTLIDDLNLIKDDLNNSKEIKYKDQNPIKTDAFSHSKANRITKPTSIKTLQYTDNIHERINNNNCPFFSFINHCRVSPFSVHLCKCCIVVDTSFVLSACHGHCQNFLPFDSIVCFLSSNTRLFYFRYVLFEPFVVSCLSILASYLSNTFNSDSVMSFYSFLLNGRVRVQFSFRLGVCLE